MAAETTVDVVDSEIGSRTSVLKDLRAAGFKARGYAPGDFPAALKAGPPQVVLARAEPGSPTLDRMLRELAGNACRWMPLVVVGQDDGERAYTQGFKTGIVDAWKSAAQGTFPVKLKALLAALPERPDTWQGTGDGRLLTAFLAHARKSQRTGRLTVKDKRGEEGQISLVDGQVQSATYQGRAKQDALKALGVLGQATLTFTQPHHAPEPGIVVALELPPPSAPPPPPAPLAALGAGPAPAVPGLPAPPPPALDAFEPIVAGAEAELPPELSPRPPPASEPLVAPAAEDAPGLEPEAPAISGELLPSAAAAPGLSEDLFEPLERSRSDAPDPADVLWQAPPGGAAAAARAGHPVPLPVPAPAPRPAPAPAGRAAAAAPALPPATPEPILLVDDDADLRRLFSSFFGKKGYLVRTAEDGAEALTAAAAELPGLVLADLNMPRLDGWALLRLLREDVRTREVPIALFSCHDDYREALRAAQAGAHGFFPKTMRLDALEKQLRELLEPRARFRRAVEARQADPIDLAALGPAWVLRTLGALGFTGALEAADTWARFRAAFTAGLLGEVEATVGSHTARGDAALQALVAVRRAEGSLSFEPPAEPGRTEPVAEALARVLGVLAAQQAHVRTATLRKARGFEVNQPLYALYLQVGPPQLRDAARALCEARLHPREVAEQAGLSLAEMEAFVLDLVRRGVVTLT